MKSAMAASSSGPMKSSFISLLLVAACNAGESDLSTPAGMHTVTVIGGGISYCDDGRMCPLDGTGCLDNSFCVQHNATTTIEPAGQSCGLTGPCFDEGTTVHVTITGGGAAHCQTIKCSVTPAAAMQNACAITLVMDADYSIAVGCQ